MKISIILVNQDNMGGINESILSIKNQTYDNFECVMVDNASVDMSRNIMDMHAKADPRFKTVFMPARVSEEECYEAGLVNLTGSVLFKMKSNNILCHLDFFGMAAVAFKKHPSVGIVYGISQAFNPKGEWIDSIGLSNGVGEGNLFMNGRQEDSTFMDAERFAQGLHSKNVVPVTSMMETFNETKKAALFIHKVVIRINTLPEAMKNLIWNGIRMQLNHREEAKPAIPEPVKAIETPEPVKRVYKGWPKGKPRKPKPEAKEVIPESQPASI